jgi:hypothetical protein
MFQRFREGIKIRSKVRTTGALLRTMTGGIRQAT